MAEQHGGVESIADIPADLIRDALKGAMVMGLPVNPADRPTFYFTRSMNWDEHDSEDNPWDWAVAPDGDTLKSPVQPIAAYEFFSPLGRLGAVYTEVGDFSATTLIFTLMDDDYKKVEGFSYATIGNSKQKWYFRFWRPISGLGGMAVYQIHCVAEGLD